MIPGSIVKNQIMILLDYYGLATQDFPKDPIHSGTNSEAVGGVLIHSCSANAQVGAFRTAALDIALSDVK
jgi:hypothetical protein